jgi:hypothetical protein
MPNSYSMLPKYKWSKLSAWQKGGLVGVIFGLLENLLFLIFGDNILGFWADFTSEIIGNPICDLLNMDIGEECGWFFFFWGFIIFPVIYGIIGMLIGLFISKVKPKK